MPRRKIYRKNAMIRFMIIDLVENGAVGCRIIFRSGLGWFACLSSFFILLRILFLDFRLVIGACRCWNCKLFMVESFWWWLAVGKAVMMMLVVMTVVRTQRQADRRNLNVYKSRFKHCNFSWWFSWSRRAGAVCWQAALRTKSVVWRSWKQSVY